MYNEFFGLNRSPFDLSPDPFFMFSSAKSHEALSLISYAVSRRKGFAVMTGEVGTGKTLLLRCLFELWERDQIPFAYFIGARLSTIDFFSYITSELGIQVAKRTKGNLLRALYGFFLAQYANGLTTVLVIDEAHELSLSVLEEIRLLTNFETAEQKLVQIVLVGQPELDEKLDSIELRSLKQRIAVRCQLEPLREQEVRPYIERRLALAGAGSQATTIFPPETIKAIYDYSLGIPRLVNSVCDHALTIAYTNRVHVVPPETVEEVARYLHLQSAPLPSHAPTPSVMRDPMQEPPHDTSPAPGAVVDEPPAIGRIPGDQAREKPVVTAGRHGDELLESFEDDFRKAWVSTENETKRTGDKPASTFLTKEVEEVCSRMGAEGALIALQGVEGVVCVASTGDAPAVGSRLQLVSQLTRECLASGQAMVCEDVESGWGAGPSIAKSLHLRSAVAVPILAQGSSVGVIEVFSSRPSNFSATQVAELEQAASSLAANPAVLGIVNLESSPLAARPGPGAAAEPVTYGSASASGQIKVPESAEVAPAGVTLPTPSPPEALPDATRDFLRAGAMGREAESVTRGAEKRTPARAWLPAVAALIVCGFLFWLGVSRPRGIKTSSGPTSPGASVTASPSAENSEAIRNASRAEEEKPSADVDAARAEHGNTAGTGASLPAPELQSTAGSANNRATIAQDMSHPSAYARTAASRTSAPTLEATNRQPLERPLEPARAAIPAAAPPAIPPVNPAPNPALPPALNPPAPIRPIAIPRPDFVLGHTLTGHSGWVTGVAFSADGRRLASGSWDQTVRFWDVSTGQELSTIGGKMKEVQAVALSRDGHWLAAENSNDTVTLWDANTGRETQTLLSNKPLGAPGSNWVYSIAFSPDGRWLASGVDDKTVRLWDVTTGRVVRDLTGSRRSVIYAAFSPDGRLLASGDDDKSIRIWDASTGQEIRRLSGHKKAIYAVVFSPDGRWLASASADKTVRLWDVATGQELHTFIGHEGIVTSLAFSPDGRWLASGSWDKTIKIWDVQTGLEVQTLTGHDHSVYSIAFDSTGQWLASGSEDGKINLWRAGGSADQARSR